MRKNRLSTLLTIAIAALIMFIGYKIVNNYMASNYAGTLNNIQGENIDIVSDTSYETIILSERFDNISMSEYSKCDAPEEVINLAEVIAPEMECNNISDLECYKKGDFEYLLLLEQPDGRVYFYVNTKTKECDFEIDVKTYKWNMDNINRDIENFLHNTTLLKTKLTDKIILLMRTLAANGMTNEEWKDCEDIDDETLFNNYIKDFDKEVIYNEEKIYIMYEMKKSYLIIKYNYNSKKYCGINYVSKK